MTLSGEAFHDFDRATSNVFGERGAEAIDWRLKGFPSSLHGCHADEIAASRLNVLAGDFPMPVAIIKKSAIEYNSAWMRVFTETAGVDLCPHGKTTMSPEIFALQREAGAWGMTAATAHHVRAYRRWGCRRIILANQLIAAADIDIILTELGSDPELDFYCLVDSLEGIERLADEVRVRRQPMQVQVLIEIGAEEGRTGVRNVEAGVELARAVERNRDTLKLRGVELFEGVSVSGAQPEEVAADMLGRTLGLVRTIDEKGLFSAGDIILTGGGSSLFDLCVQELKRALVAERCRIVLRSGCYIVHDHGVYAHAIAALSKRSPWTNVLGAPLRPAVEIVGVVQSVPERALAIVSLGKRDIGFDTDLPIPLWRFRSGEQSMPIEAGVGVSGLYDQHLLLRGSQTLQVGDILGFGISHPCATFDRWRAMLVVDDDYFGVGMVTTNF